MCNGIKKCCAGLHQVMWKWKLTVRFMHLMADWLKVAWQTGCWNLPPLIFTFIVSDNIFLPWHGTQNCRQLFILFSTCWSLVRWNGISTPYVSSNRLNCVSKQNIKLTWITVFKLLSSSILYIVYDGTDSAN